jgi:peptidoglycan/xylan/chitin deacetylase (PgdA/CDA1 family)
MPSTTSKQARSRSWLVALSFLVLSAGGLPALQPPPALPTGVPTKDAVEGATIVLGGGEDGPAPAPAAGRLGDRALVLCWHSFLGDPSLETDFSLGELKAQLASLSALGYRFVDLDDAMAGRITGSLNLVATIDDGHRTVPKAVEEAFLPLGIKPALFVYPAIIGSVPYAMADAELRRLGSEGCRIGAHGYHHLFVTEALFRSDRAEFDKEIYKAKTKTEGLSGLPVLFYAYPFGAYSPVTTREVEKAGYSFAFAVRPGFIYADPALNLDFEIPRVVLRRDNWDEVYAFLKRNAEGARELEAQLLTGRLGGMARK